MRSSLLIWMLLSMILSAVARVFDICQQQPTVKGLCASYTMGIYFDLETQHCKYMGCSPDRKLFATLEDCEKICNNTRHRNRRLHNGNQINID